jgi:hypothetical protein
MLVKRFHVVKNGLIFRLNCESCTSLTWNVREVMQNIKPPTPMPVSFHVENPVFTNGGQKSKQAITTTKI